MSRHRVAPLGTPAGCHRPDDDSLQARCPSGWTSSEERRTQDTLELTELVAAHDFDGINVWLAEHGALDIADELTRLEPTDQPVLIDALADDSVHEFFLHIDADDRARLLDEVPTTVASKLLAERLNIDPAVVSALVITTLVDATGLIISFLLARAVLGI